MKKFRFLDWKVYQDSKELFSFLLKIVKEIPKEYRFEIGSQIVRSGFSITLNIAEGSGKSSDKDFARFIDISLGSAYEVLASADVLRDNKIITSQDFERIEKMVISISNQLGGLKKKLKGI